MLAELFPLVFLELSAFFVCVQTALWVLDGPTPIPTIAPYIRRAKRPPSYLDRCLNWLNTTIDKGADSIAPCIRVRRGTRSFSTGAARYPQQVTHKGMRRLPQPNGVLDVIFKFVKYFLVKGKLLWWRCQGRPLQRAAARLLALTAIATGIARANAAVSNNRSRRAIFDSDSFDILVDSGATACISNDLSDFVTPPKTSTTRVKGFNGTTSSTRVGTVQWSVLDDTGQRRNLRIKNTYYVPACPLRLLSPQHYSQQL
jgi:hypothetical protein